MVKLSKSKTLMSKLRGEANQNNERYKTRCIIHPCHLNGNDEAAVLIVVSTSQRSSKRLWLIINYQQSLNGPVVNKGWCQKLVYRHPGETRFPNGITKKKRQRLIGIVYKSKKKFMFDARRKTKHKFGGGGGAAEQQNAISSNSLD